MYNPSLYSDENWAYGGELMERQSYVRTIVSLSDPVKKSGHGWAPVNIALCKYWGKRNAELNLPTASSLSVSLSKGTQTDISWHSGKDQIFLNEQPLLSTDPFSTRLSRFLDLFRPGQDFGFVVRTSNDVPTKAGLASSASGFAAAVMALNDLFDWKLSNKNLSLLARLGSGSACRSIDRGFVLWKAGLRGDGLDSYAEKLPLAWPELRLGILLVDSSEKAVGSKEGMLRTQETSKLYPLWPRIVEEDIIEIQSVIQKRDFSSFGRIVESNAMTMHATMLSAWPPLCYWTDQTLSLLKLIWKCREEGLLVYASMDAGPNIKLFYLAKDQEKVVKAFPELMEINLLA